MVRKMFMNISHFLFTFVLIFGYLTAAICARSSCPTFPFVGNSYFIMPKHLIADIPFWKNFTENKLIVQVMHRTLASCFVLYGTY